MKNQIKIIVVNIILIFLGYLAGTRVYLISKGLVNYSTYGQANLLIDSATIVGAVLLSWAIWHFLIRK